MGTVNALQLTSSTNDTGSPDYANKSALKAPETTAADSVHVSASAQAELLEQSGESVAEIAANLGVTTQIVDQYLDITTATTSPQVPVVQAAHHQK
jgi:geranylgeranyl pyrophosphate synthase